MKKFIVFVFIVGLLVVIGFLVTADVRKNIFQTSSGINETDPTFMANPPGVTPTCGGKAFPQVTEGPYYKKGSPEKQDIRGNVEGEEFVLEGYVLDIQCRPVANAWVDFWQADGNGNYDKEGYRLRGHQYTDKYGRYRLVTVLPGQYTGRTEHIHFKIKASETSPELTSQLFFPKSDSNNEDIFFEEALLVTMKDEKSGEYNFIIPVSSRP